MPFPEVLDATKEGRREGGKEGRREGGKEGRRRVCQLETLWLHPGCTACKASVPCILSIINSKLFKAIDKPFSTKGERLREDGIGSLGAGMR